MRLDIKPADRHSILVWRQYPTGLADPGWRCAEAVNGCPIEFGARFNTWREAFDEALRLIGMEA